MTMKVSLILATLGRDQELVEFLNSLKHQTYSNFELIIIDQNKDNKIDSIIESFRGCFDVNHIKVDFSGNARARDYGIVFSRGGIIAFPDDDCVYEYDVLEKVVEEFMHRMNIAIMAVGSYDFSKSNFSIGVNTLKPRYFSRLNMMGVEFTHFFHLNRIDKSQLYLDHDFGIGSKYPGAEGFEFLYRLLRSNGKAFYNPNIKIFHADKDSYKLGYDRMLRYSEGVGAYFRKFANQHDVYILYYIFRKMFIAPILKLLVACLSLNPKRMAYSFYNLVGIWRGFLAYSG